MVNAGFSRLDQFRDPHTTIKVKVSEERGEDIEARDEGHHKVGAGQQPDPHAVGRLSLTADSPRPSPGS